MARKLVNLKVGSDVLVPKVVVGVDTNNVIATLSTTQNYTFTEDCWCMLNFANAGGSSAFYFNDIRMDSYTFSMRQNSPMFIAKANDNIRTEQQNLKGTVLYGLKY